MALRPGNRFEMSSHFMPLPLRSIMIASSSCDHLLCFFAGDSDGWEGMLRFPPVPVGARTCGGMLEGTVVDGTEAALVCCCCCFSVCGEDGDSSESGALRRREISTLTVLSRRYRQS
jgi:hypothetical protein